MKHLVILGDGMADWPVAELGGKTLLQYAPVPHMDRLAKQGRCGLLQTVPQGFHPGSEVANSSILGYNQHLVYEGRGPLEAASIGVSLQPGDLALRCNLVCLEGNLLKNHSCGRLETHESDVLIRHLQQHLGNERIQFHTGVQYRNLLIIRGGDKRLQCTPPHDIPLQPFSPHLPKALCPEAEETAQLLNTLMQQSRQLLQNHPLNRERVERGMDPANCIWPWGGGYRPQMVPLTQRFSQIKSGAVITAVDLIRGIGTYAGLQVVDVPGATGLFDTDYEAKARAALKALQQHDFVYLHVEASDEAGHEGNVQLKLQTITDLDHRLLAPIMQGLADFSEPVSVALLPDHPTPCQHRTHTAEPVPFCICAPGLQPDAVQAFSEVDCAQGGYGTLQADEFICAFMQN